MNTVQAIQLYRTKTDYAIYKDRVLVHRVHDRRYAFKIAKQVFDATKKLATGPVFFDDFTGFTSEV